MSKGSKTESSFNNVRQWASHCVGPFRPSPGCHHLKIYITRNELSTSSVSNLCMNELAHASKGRGNAKAWVGTNPDEDFINIF